MEHSYPERLGMSAHRKLIGLHPAARALTLACVLGLAAGCTVREPGLQLTRLEPAPQGVQQTGRNTTEMTWGYRLTSKAHPKRQQLPIRLRNVDGTPGAVISNVEITVTQNNDPKTAGAATTAAGKAATNSTATAKVTYQNGATWGGQQYVEFIARDEQGRDLAKPDAEPKGVFARVELPTWKCQYQPTGAKTPEPTSVVTDAVDRIDSMWIRIAPLTKETRCTP